MAVTVGHDFESSFKLGVGRRVYSHMIDVGFVLEHLSSSLAKSYPEDLMHKQCALHDQDYRTHVSVYSQLRNPWRGGA